MKENEIRYRLSAALLQAKGPMSFSELRAQASVPAKAGRAVLRGLVDEGLVVEGKLHLGGRGLQYRWRDRWAQERRQGAADSKRELREAVGATTAGGLDIDGEAVLAFHNHVIHRYEPPPDKRFLVFLQCSVRRPFSTSPSHGAMRRAISVATGFDPARDFERCPVHVVVLASRIGPAPYELEDVYPANVRGGGVKHFDPLYYSVVKPILAERMAEYITAHGDSYDKIASFTQGRYAEVMSDARDLAGRDFPILPVEGGATVTTGRPYWEKYWVQLYLRITGWLPPAQRKQAEERLAQMDLAIDWAGSRRQPTL